MLQPFLLQQSLVPFLCSQMRAWRHRLFRGRNRRNHQKFSNSLSTPTSHGTIQNAHLAFFFADLSLDNITADFGRNTFQLLHTAVRQYHISTSLTCYGTQQVQNHTFYRFSCRNKSFPTCNLRLQPPTTSVSFSTTAFLSLFLYC